MRINRGDVFYVSLGEGIGSEQNGDRPCLIIQNDIGNTYSPTTIIACLTTAIKTNLPTHVHIGKGDTTEHKNRFGDSIVLLEQIRTVDKRRLHERIARLTPSAMTRVDKALATSVYQKIFAQTIIKNT